MTKGDHGVRAALSLQVGLFAALLLPLPAEGAATEPRFPVVDLHVDLPYQVAWRGRPLERGTGQFRAADLGRAGVVGVVLPLYVPMRASPEGPRRSHYEATHRRVLEVLPATPPYAPPGCGARAEGRVRTWFSFEGAGMLAENPDSVKEWIARGVRIFGLVHTRDNAAGTSSSTVPAPREGLTDRGRAVVTRVLEQGALPDVSHLSDAATHDVLALASARDRPVVATHSGARALTPHPRNLTDEQARAIAATGGVIGVPFHSPFLGARRRARLDDAATHIEHLVAVAGARHVAIGSDFEGDIRPPRDLADVRALPRLARRLRERGMPEATVRAVFSENALRVLCPAPD